MDPISSSSSKHQRNDPTPSLPASVSQVARLLTSYDPTLPTEKDREWKHEDTDTSLYNKIQTIAQMLRSQKQD